MMVKQSKFLSWALRHAPEEAGITLDENGWAKVSDVLAILRTRFGSFTLADLTKLVETNDKKRFALDTHRQRIRASQGHSIAVDLELEPVTPPKTLFHGTKRGFLGTILRDGLRPQKRQHVHLSGDIETARKVAGRRQGDDILLLITTEGIGPFYRSANGVWLTAFVPPEALTVDLFDPDRPDRSASGIGGNSSTDDGSAADERD